MVSSNGAGVTANESPRDSKALFAAAGSAALLARVTATKDASLRLPYGVHKCGMGSMHLNTALAGGG